MASGPDAGIIMADPQMLRNIAAAIGVSDFARAANIAQTALNSGMRHPTFFNARALLAQHQGRYQDAADDFTRSLSYTPRNVTLLNAIGLCLVRLNRPGEAVATFNEAISIAPGQAEIHYRKGWAYDAMSDQAGAKDAYERAIALRPEFPEALAALAVIAARNGDLTGAREYAGRSLRLDPDEPTAVVALAIADIADKLYAAAETRLRLGLAGPRVIGHTRAVMLGYLADALDGQDRFADAFAAYVEKNEEHRRVHEGYFANRPRSIVLLDQLVRNFEATSAQEWERKAGEPETSDQPRQHVFLLGFLRSGTTLLEQVLATHPDIAALEERETFIDLVSSYLSDKAGLERLAVLSGEQLELARKAYWARVREFGGEPGGKVFIDKQPLNTFNLPLIAKLFPKARILFALRDPRDVVFSCFRRHFGVNATTFELLRLDDAARYYSSVMRMGELCREKLPLTLHTHRYEDMVRDFDASVQAVCEFIGVEWRQEMRDFSASARDKTIRSPSASQVRRQLYDEGIGQWHRYAAQLSPIFPILQPWIVKFWYQPG